MNDMNELTRLNRELVEASRDIKVLSELAWPPQIQEQFLTAWQQGKPRNPDVSYEPVDHTGQLQRLEAIAAETNELEHPLAQYVQETALSYLDAGRMVQLRGSPAMSELSIAIYGRPGDPLTGGNGTSSLDAARYFLDVGKEFYHSYEMREADLCLTAQAVKEHLETGLAAVFNNQEITVSIDRNLASKAAAGATRIRLRDASCFSAYDPEQLLQHEAFVHSLTALNGRQQSAMPAMSLGAPRTTATQEGLATFAELVTGSIDIARLERVAMRIIAIDMALGGADFVDVFRYFIDEDQPPTESYNSTMRVFRGVPTTGGHAFTKDAVYLHGLMEVHTFFRWAFKNQRLAVCEHVFAGRMTLDDAIRYDPFFLDGTLCPAKYLPPWMTRSTGLAGYLAFSVFANSIDPSLRDSEPAPARS